MQWPSMWFWLPRDCDVWLNLLSFQVKEAESQQNEFKLLIATLNVLQ